MSLRSLCCVGGRRAAISGVETRLSNAAANDPEHTNLTLIVCFYPPCVRILNFIKLYNCFDPLLADDAGGARMLTGGHRRVAVCSRAGGRRQYCVPRPVPPHLQTGATTGIPGDGLLAHREAQRLPHAQQRPPHQQQAEEGAVLVVPAADRGPLHHARDGQLVARGMPHLLRLQDAPRTHMLLQGQEALL
ncbi:hypothetical protein JTE90_000289 [Oedothorax gibbosus]|uniref:Uncharacterized protein n=1 Tax=Oedothorax gibbosus TaxID=931172 RepID=A0AAV6VVC4_9ARAC|nr:hypothetical protein JTE90_000289 [Oedothorax gibbosus]